MADTTAFIIVGRSVRDYIACGSAPPAASVQTPCVFCGETIALGAAGQNTLKTKGVRCFVFCSP